MSCWLVLAGALQLAAQHICRPPMHYYSSNDPHRCWQIYTQDSRQLHLASQSSEKEHHRGVTAHNRSQHILADHGTQPITAYTSRSKEHQNTSRSRHVTDHSILQPEFCNQSFATVATGVPAATRVLQFPRHCLSPCNTCTHHRWRGCRCSCASCACPCPIRCGASQVGSFPGERQWGPGGPRDDTIKGRSSITSGVNLIAGIVSAKNICIYIYIYMHMHDMHICIHMYVHIIIFMMCMYNVKKNKHTCIYIYIIYIYMQYMFILVLSYVRQT